MLKREPGARASRYLWNLVQVPGFEPQVAWLYRKLRQPLQNGSVHVSGLRHIQRPAECSHSATQHHCTGTSGQPITALVRGAYTKRMWKFPGLFTFIPKRILVWLASKTPTLSPPSHVFILLYIPCRVLHSVDTTLPRVLSPALLTIDCRRHLLCATQTVLDALLRLPI